jgi:glutaminase
LFNVLDQANSGKVALSDITNLLRRVGIRENDPRIKPALNKIGPKSTAKASDVVLNLDAFKQLVQHTRGNLLRDAIQGNLIIPDFETFSEKLQELYEQTRGNNAGEVASYIPQLGRVNPEQFGVAACTISGQQVAFGESDVAFCIQSMAKPLNYCLALEQFGEDKVHQHVGREPSGVSFNMLALNQKGLPHNPMINAGAIMTCSLVRPELAMADRFDYVQEGWRKATGGGYVGFNNAVYLSERQTADRNFALGYFMRENHAFPENTQLIDTLEFYFQCCSIESNAESLAVVAATLANGGICPTTGERVFSSDTVKNCLSLMYSCGMYDYSGEWSFMIGLPAKSGVAGGILVVVPNVMGLCIWSPRLDEIGNSVRGIDFSRRLVNTYNFHNYDSLTTNQDKLDPRLHRNQQHVDSVVALCWAAATGDLLETQHLLAMGSDVNAADYDGRTALHLAASEGHLPVVELLLAKGANPVALDRWGNSPLTDAERGQHGLVATSLLNSMPKA